MFVYKNKEYGSKAEVVRELYNLGETSLNSNDKKKLAEELGMTVQTVHATIMKFIGKAKGPKSDKPKKKIDVAVVQAKNKLNQKVTTAKSTKAPIFINDTSDEVKKELMKDPNKIAVTWAPNQWGLSITVPPLYVIDENFDPDWIEPPEETIERNWE